MVRAVRALSRQMTRLRLAPDTAQRHRLLAGLAGEAHTVLDVGGVEGQLAAFMPTARVTSVNVDEAAAVRFDGETLPFEDAAFDIVTSADVLEHVAPQGRARHVQECARVARRRVVLCCPSGPRARRGRTRRRGVARAGHGIAAPVSRRASGARAAHARGARALRAVGAGARVAALPRRLQDHRRRLPRRRPAAQAARAEDARTLRAPARREAGRRRALRRARAMDEPRLSRHRPRGVIDTPDPARDRGSITAGT